MMKMPPTTATRQFAMLVLVEVQRKKVAELKDLLKVVGEQTLALMQGRPLRESILPFEKMETVHYARFVLLDEDDATLDPMLAFSTDYDGPEGEDACPESRAYNKHIQDLQRHGGAGFDSIFQCCEGYRAGQLAPYFTQHRRAASTNYIGTSGRSVFQIRWEAALRDRVNSIIDEGNWTASLPEQVRERVLEKLTASADGPIPTFPPQPDLHRNVRTAIVRLALLAGVFLVLVIGAMNMWLQLSLAAALGVTVGFVALLALVAVWRFRRLELTDPQFQPNVARQTVERSRHAASAENHFLQNQLTHLVTIKPGPLRWALIRVVFRVLQLLSTNVYNNGTLGGIPAIHFARWALVRNRRVLFLSNFDSSWQNYLGDFIDKASSGVTAVWSNSIEYPRTRWLLRAGSRDAARFLAWARDHQLPTQVWFSAYPGLSVVNINDNTELRRGLADRAAVDAATWLLRLRSVDRPRVDGQFSDEQTRDPPLPLKQIQGIILKGYAQMPEARYLLYTVARPGADLLAWLSGLPLTSAEDAASTARSVEPFLNVAFTHPGLRALGLDETLCQRFSTPFIQGSNDAYRARVNGDVEESDPREWAWGAGQSPVHLALLVYASEKTVLTHAAELKRQAKTMGLTLVADLQGTTLPGRTEHFGFRDGIAQPTVQGSGRAEKSGNTIAAGEFLLGHGDGYGNVSPSPVGSSGFNFGLNGSYMVFRQLEQNVAAFWRYCATQGGANGGAITVASKMVGRWPSGALLVRYPDEDPRESRASDEDDFNYLANDKDNDRYGGRCPFGAHIRRCNPRDWGLGENRDESSKLSNLHRIVRRGRPYGRPLHVSLAPADMIQVATTETAPDTEERGLQFLCFNSNIERQYEFIQQQWLNNPKFAGLGSDADPLLGFRQPAARLGTGAFSFSMQHDMLGTIRPRCTDLQSFVRVRGSAYFFMPSIPAVRLLPECVQTALSGDTLESPPPDEQLAIDSLVFSLREKMKRDYVQGKTLRDAHPKMHGCVRAVFKIAEGLDPRLRVGLFKEPREIKAWVRFSNQDGHVSSDTKRDIRGAAIKLLDVPGFKLIDGGERCSTHDFVLISTDSFVTKDVAEFAALIRAVVAGSVPRFLLNHPRVAWNLVRSMKKHTSVAAIQYFSVAPYLLGTTAVKYTLKPAASTSTAVTKNAGYNHLREDLKARLTAGPVEFAFMVQLPDPLKKLSIEDPSVAWRERDTTFHKVATLEIFQQEFDTPGQQEFGDNLSFNPWRCLPEHRPLGGINRARRQVYRALSRFRHDRNSVPSEEPTEHGAIP